MSRLASNNIQGIIDQLTTQRKADVSSIEGLFDTFGVTAKQDVSTAFEKARATQSQDLISRGLSQTTKRTTGRTDLLEKELRAGQRIDEQVAGQKAGFRASQLVDPSLITNLIQGASAVDTTPVQAFGGINSAALNRPNSAFDRSGIDQANARSATNNANLQGARTITRASQSQGGATQGARTIPSPNAAPSVGTPAGTGGAPSLRSGQASGSGSIRNTQTGQGFETKTGQDAPTAIGAEATDVTAPAGTGGEGRTVTARATSFRARKPIGSTVQIKLPPGMTNLQAVQQGQIPLGHRIISG
jgi:hypothetical protein